MFAIKLLTGCLRLFDTFAYDVLIHVIMLTTCIRLNAY